MRIKASLSLRCPFPVKCIKSISSFDDEILILVLNFVPQSTSGTSDSKL